MKLTVIKANTSQANSKDIVEIEHQGEILCWDISCFSKTSGSGEPFEELNRFWEYAPLAVQDQCFDKYREINQVFGIVRNDPDLSDRLTRQLRPLIRDLYNYVQISDFDHWVTYHSRLTLPFDLVETYAESSESHTTRGKTYTRKDYRLLVSLSIALRMMLPIWGEFINRTRSPEQNGTVFKEYHAYKLLNQCSLIDSEPMQKLSEYVYASVSADKPKTSAVLGALSSEDFPIWILGLVVTRRVAVAELKSLRPEDHLVRVIFGYIRNKTEGHDNIFIGRITAKTLEGVGQEGEKNLSKLEGYKQKQDISAGDVAIINHFIQKNEEIIQRLAPDLNRDLLIVTRRTVKILETERIEEPQLKLMQWVLKPVISPKGLIHLDKLAMLDKMAITQAMLWHRGHKELAVLLTGRPLNTGDGMQVNGVTTRNRVSDEIKETLNKLYPYTRRNTGKNKDVQQTNSAIEAIESMDDQFSEHVWGLTVPPDWVEQITGNKNNREYCVPANIRTLLANLIIAIGSRKF